MKHAVVLDTGVLGLVTNPKHSEDVMKCSVWLESLLAKNYVVCLPEICDYELRRELILADLRKALGRLDELKAALEYLPITTSVMLSAAEFWARARKKGHPTADNKALDGDMILAAQTAAAASSFGLAIIATTNVKHLSLFAEAKPWQDINVG